MNRFVIKAGMSAEWREVDFQKLKLILEPMIKDYGEDGVNALVDEAMEEIMDEQSPRKPDDCDVAKQFRLNEGQT